MIEYIDEQEYKDKIGIYIKQMCERVGIYSSKELAEKLNVSTALVSNWECGIKMPSYQYSIAIAGMLGISIDDFYEMKDVYKLEDTKSLNLIVGDKNAFNKLKYSRQKELVTEYIKVRSKVKNTFSDLCHGKEIDENEFLKMLSIADVNIGFSIFRVTLKYRRTNGIYIIEKIDTDFDFDNIETKDIELLYNDDNNLKSQAIHNYNNVVMDGYYYSSQIRKFKEIRDYFINEYTGMYEDEENGFYVIDRNGHKAFVKVFDLNFYSKKKVNDFNKKSIETYKSKINELYSIVKKDNVLDELALIGAGLFGDDLINEYVYKLLFDERFYFLLDDFVKSLTINEKNELFFEYIHECNKMNIKIKTYVLYKFMANGTLLITDYSPMEINYDYNLTYLFAKKIMECVFNHKEVIDVDDLPEI